MNHSVKPSQVDTIQSSEKMKPKNKNNLKDTSKVYRKKIKSNI